MSPLEITPSPPLPKEKWARQAADIILRGFEELHARFAAITQRAVERFESRDWEALRRDTVSRLGLYPRSVAETLQAIEDELGVLATDRERWAALKKDYSMAILGRDDFELAQTFFNSLTRRVFSHTGVDPAIDFLSRDFPLPYKGWELASARMYATRRITPDVMRRILLDAGFRAPWRNLEESAAGAARVLAKAVDRDLGGGDIDALDFLRPIFIRNKAAYLVGRVRQGGELLPAIIAILHQEDGLVLDAVVHSENEASIVFSFARWYFHAQVASPRQVIGFLHSILPRKRIPELFLSLGYTKHGKTELYSDLMTVIAGSNDRFVVAPGQRGMVMEAFTLPSYEFVFKIIKDHFPPPKRTSRRGIMERYRQVHLHDRVGRLVDFQEFEHLEFPRDRFAPELLRELLETCSRNVIEEGNDVIIRHLYVGRRVVPLDLYLAEAPWDARRQAILDWGLAIKELAAANIFPGDMLIKNFGVTRHGRVVFYDYDEICPLSDCRFRRIPEARDELEELSPEPWFTVAEGDVFPEELLKFLGFEGELKEFFVRHHGDLFDIEFWRTVQERHREGDVIDFFPYGDNQRL